MLLKTLSFLRDCFKQHFIGEHTKMAFDDNSILCLSCGQEAEQNPIFSSKDFVRAEGQQGKEKIKMNG
jgi:hypothetical protein